MDSVRFGRALGFGARSAAKALAGAVDAATAPNPTAKTASKPARHTSAPSSAPPASIAGKPRDSDPVVTAARAAAHATVQAREASKGVARGSRRFGKALWEPLAKVSVVLWLEMTGAFFGIFAIFAGQATWTHRADLRSSALNHEAHVHAFVFLAMALLFGYFCISSFIRAHRR